LFYLFGSSLDVGLSLIVPISELVNFNLTHFFKFKKLQDQFQK
jgi:hypothetical protein